MVTGPVVGYFIGDWLDDKLGTQPYLMIIMIVLGFVASGKETYRLLKRASDDGKNTDDNFRT
jgi:F0F1-type ATP synthase assembly protein I